MGDQDPDASAPAAGGRCPCCSSPSGAAWRRSVKRKLGAEKEGLEEEEAGSTTARVEAEEECVALREAVAAAQASAALLQAELEEERLAAATAASETMAMMLRLQRDKAEVQMELRQFRRFADEKMALDAAEVDHLRALLARRARRLLRLRATLREYRLQFLHLGIPLPEGEDQNGGDEDDDLLTLQGEAEDGDGGYYPELRCYDGEYYYVEEQEEGGVAVDLERRICRLEHDNQTQLLESPLEEDDGDHIYTDEVLPESSGPERGILYANQMLPGVSVEEWNRLGNDEEEMPESPDAGCGSGEEGASESGVSSGSGSGSGSDRVYTIDKVHQQVSAPIARVPEKYLNEEVEPDIKKLYMRLEALEADRESMRQALVAMRTEKAQLVLLREIAQQLAKDGAPAGAGAGAVSGVQHPPGKCTVGVAERRFMAEKKAALVKKYSMVTLLKWILTLFCKKKKPRQSRYTFGMSSNSVGLLLLLDKRPRIQRTLTRTK